MDRQTKENHNTFKHFEEVSLILVQTIDCIQKMDITFVVFSTSKLGTQIVLFFFFFF